MLSAATLKSLEELPASAHTGLGSLVLTATVFPCPYCVSWKKTCLLKLLTGFILTGAIKLWTALMGYGRIRPMPSSETGDISVVLRPEFFPGMIIVSVTGRRDLTSLSSSCFHP